MFKFGFCLNGCWSTISSIKQRKCYSDGRIGRNLSSKVQDVNSKEEHDSCCSPSEKPFEVDSKIILASDSKLFMAIFGDLSHVNAENILINQPNIAMVIFTAYRNQRSNLVKHSNLRQQIILKRALITLCTKR